MRASTIQPSTIKMSNRILWHVVSIWGKDKEHIKVKVPPTHKTASWVCLRVNLLGIECDPMNRDNQVASHQPKFLNHTHCPTPKPWATCRTEFQEGYSQLRCTVKCRLHTRFQRFNIKKNVEYLGSFLILIICQNDRVWDMLSEIKCIFKVNFKIN